MNIGEHIRVARKSMGLTQAEVAVQAGVSRSAVVELEAGGGRMPTLAAVASVVQFRITGLSNGRSIGEQVRNRRKVLGWRQSETALRAGVSMPTLRAVERDRAHVDSLAKVIAAIANAPRARTRDDKARLNNINRKALSDRLTRTETYRTPSYSFTPLLDYRPDWFSGRGCDPSAGDGRMLREIAARGNDGPHWANDLREEEEALMRRALPSSATITVGDYLAVADPPQADFLMTNPPFTLAMDFVQKARSHIRGPICILQSVAWQGTKKRSKQLREAGLAYVLNLPRRPKWEVDAGVAHSNIWDFAWFVFLPGYHQLPQMDWLNDPAFVRQFG
jgi:transcriptional regulator with XRE-family HTH domain